MGGSSWSDDFYDHKNTTKASTGTPTFAYHAAVSAKAAVDPTAVKAHDKLNPFGVKFRESRDSAAHPESNSIVVLFDETGSMGDIPRQLQKKLPQLMSLLLRKNYIEHPQILFGAIGDAYSDRVPLQVGQFESGVEMDDDLTNIYLEGNGGGQNKESYELAMYFMARHTAMDCWEKRGKQGYLFMVGDEYSYPKIDKKVVERIIGDKLEADIPTSEIVAELKERFHTFFIIPRGASHGGEKGLLDHWKGLLGGENVLYLDQPDGVCEAIATAIGLIEGSADLDAAKADLKAAGASASTVASVVNAVTPLANTTALAKPGTTTGNLPAKSGKSANVDRL